MKLQHKAPLRAYGVWSQYARDVFGSAGMPLARGSAGMPLARKELHLFGYYYRYSCGRMYRTRHYTERKV